MTSVGRALIGRGSIYALVTVLQSAAFFAVLPVLTRRLGPTEYGLVATCTVVYQVVLVIAPLGLPSVVAWDMYEGRPDAHETSRRLAASAWWLAVLVVLCLHLTGPLWSKVFDAVPYPGALSIAVLTGIPGAALAISQAILQAEGRPFAFAVSTLTSILLGQGVGLAAVVLGGAGAVAYLTGVLLGSTAGAIVGFALTRTRPWRMTGWRRVQAAFGHGGPTVVHGAAFIVLAAGDRVLVERLLGLREAGRYHVAYLVGALGLTAMQALNNAWAPLVHSAEEATRWDLLASTTSTMYRLAWIMTGGLAFGAPLALLVLLPREFDPGDLAAETAVVAASVIPFVTYLAAVHVVFQRRETWVLAWTTPVAGIANLALNLLLVPPFKLLGAAVATLLSYLLWAYLVRHAASVRQAVQWPRRREVRTYVIGAVLVAAGAMLPAGGGWLAVRVTLGLALLGLFLVVVADVVRERQGTIGAAEAA